MRHNRQKEPFYYVSSACPYTHKMKTPGVSETAGSACTQGDSIVLTQGSGQSEDGFGLLCEASLERRQATVSLPSPLVVEQGERGAA